MENSTAQPQPSPNSNGPQMNELAAAIRDALDLPIPATSEGWQDRMRIVSDRAAYLTGALRALAAGDVEGAAATVASVRDVNKYFPIAYETTEAGR